MNAKACGHILVSTHEACNVDYDVGYDCKITGIIEVKLKFTLKAASNNYESLAFSSVMYFESHPLTSHPHLGKVSSIQLNWVWGCCKPLVGPEQSPGGGPGGEALGSSEDTVI